MRARLVMLVLAAIVPLFGLSLAKAFLNTNAAISRASKNLEFAATLVAANQEGVADSARQTLTAISTIPELLEGRSSGCQQYFKSLVKNLPIYANLGIIGADGYIRCHGIDSTAAAFAGDRPYFQAAMAQRTFVAEGFLISRFARRPITTFALPVFDSNGKVTAVAFAAMFLEQVAKEVNLAQLPKESNLLLIDRRGIVLAANPATSAAIGRQVPDLVIREAIKTAKEGVLEGRDESGAERIYAFVPGDKSSSKSFFVVVSAVRSEVLAPARRQLFFEFLALGVVAFFGGLIAWLMGGSAIVRPTARILQATSQLQAGRLDVRIPLDPRQGPRSEFSRIAEGINSMAESLQERERDLASELANSREAHAQLQLAQSTQALSYAALGEAQRKLVDAQRLGRIGHWELDLNSGRLSMSENLNEMLGLASGQLVDSQDGFARMVHPDDRAEYVRRRVLAQSEAGELNIEFRIVTPQGDVRWMQQRGKSQHGGAGAAGTRTGVVQDITARKGSELALARSSEQLRRTGEMARVGGWETTLSPPSAEWSKELYRIHEIDPAEGSGPMQALTFYAPEAQPAMRKALQAAIQKSIPWDLELPLITARGRRIWVRTQGQPVFNDGKIIGLAGALQDITLQHDSREQLRLLESSISRLNDMVLITQAEPIDEPGPRIVYVNDAFERHTGFSRQEVLGRSPRLLQGPGTQRAELDRLRAALQAWKPFKGELINYTKSGKQFWLEIDIVPIAGPQGGFTHWVAVQRDITGRKLAEQALVDSEQRYAALFESAPVPMWIADFKTKRFVAVNDACVKRYGYSREEFLSMTIFDIRSELEARRLKLEIDSGMAHEVNRRVHRRKDGSPVHVETVSRIVPYGGVPAHFVVALDATAQFKAEQEVQEHLFMLQRAADAAQAITWHQTLDGMLHEVAEQARGVIGAHQAVVSLAGENSPSQAIVALSLSDKYASYRQFAAPPRGMDFYRMGGIGRHAVRMTQAQLEADPGGAASDHEEPHPPMRGWLAVPLMGRSGTNIGLLQLSDKYEGEFTLHDEYVAVELAQLAAIAIENAQLLEQVNQLNTGLEQKVAQRTVALARQEALFRALAEQAPQVVWTVDPGGGATYFNRAWFDLVGGTLDDWTGTQWHAAIHPEDLFEVQKNWAAATASRAPFVGIRRLLARDGSYHTMSYRASPVAGDGGEVAFWVGIDADVTEIKNIEAALRLSNQELEAFSYSVSHDLRSPLNTIDGFSRLLAKQLKGEVGARGQHYLARVQAGVAQMGKLIEDLLSLAQVSRMQLRYEKVDLSVLAVRILQEWQGRHPEREAQFDIESGLQAQGDARLVRVLMENLLGNAWKFTSQKEHAQISMGKQLDATGQTVFFVKDNGAGFDMAYADKLFIAFQRLHTASEFPGTGVGLATVSRVIGRHAGRIWADARPHHGATFFFTLPNISVGTAVGEIDNHNAAITH